MLFIVEKSPIYFSSFTLRIKRRYLLKIGTQNRAKSQRKCSTLFKGTITKLCQRVFQLKNSKLNHEEFVKQLMMNSKESRQFELPYRKMIFFLDKWKYLQKFKAIQERKTRDLVIKRFSTKEFLLVTNS